jgi:hypothetical protein
MLSMKAASEVRLEDMVREADCVTPEMSWSTDAVSATD